MPQNNSYSSLSAKTFNDYGLISLMYHRFNEDKYPSTNIQLDIFKEQLKIIEDEGIQFINPRKLKENLSKNKKNRKVLLTIDDGLLSFYKNAWPILKKREIPPIEEIFLFLRHLIFFNPIPPKTALSQSK